MTVSSAFHTNVEFLLHETQKLHQILEIQTIMRALVRTAIRVTCASSGTWGKVNDDKVSFSELISTQEVTPIHWNDRLNHLQNISGLLHAVNIPVVMRDQSLFAYFEIYTNENQFNFHSADLLILNRMASHASTAIENTQLLTQLKSTENSVKEAVLIRDEFLSITAHEFRTPLTTITLGVQSLKRIANGDQLFKASAEKLEYLINIIGDQNQRLNNLVNNLLDISQMSTGKFIIHPKKLNLSPLIEKVISELSESLTLAGCHVESNLDSEINCNCDPFRIEQVMINLLSNAIKYAPGSPIVITTKKNKDWIQLNVQDSGMGIDQENQKKIFTRFERGMSSRSTESGVGLGLYIVRQIVEAHGGTIDVQSELGKGSLFTVNLPPQ